jgi:hypothetical protein
LIDGRLSARLISVFISDGGALFTEVRANGALGKRLHVHAFNLSVLFSDDPQWIHSGRVLELSGSEVAALQEGPLGHPADGEFIVWPVQRLRVDVLFYQTGLTVELTGSTEVGACNRPDLTGFDTSARTFTLNFAVPKADFKSLFGLSDDAVDRMQALCEVHGADLPRPLF